MLLFVYGSLKFGYPYHHLLSYATAKFVSAASTKPLYALYNLGSFPGLVESSKRRCIYGEIYDIDKSKIGILDDFEGVSRGFYVRKPVEINGVDEYIETYFLQNLNYEMVLIENNLVTW